MVTSLRIVINNSKAAAGIVEWELIEGKIEDNQIIVPIRTSSTSEETASPQTPEER